LWKQEKKTFKNMKIDKDILDLMWRKSCLLWAVDNQIKTEKGDLIEFKNHRFLKDIFDDWTQIQVIRKASQIGFSTMEILKSFYGAKYKNFNIIYTLPSFSDVSQFVPSKVNALISQNPILAKMTEDKDTILQKKIGKGFIYYRGTLSRKSEAEKAESGVGIMFSSDLNIMDECDRSDQAILEQYDSRLDASKYQGKWYFSNPTTPGTLSQKLYEQSDQKYWFVKCGNNHWQWLDFFKNIKDGKFICQICGKEITDEDRRNGQWVKRYRDRNISGYWISHLNCSWISAGKIQQEYETKSKQHFYNFILGLPYIGSEFTVNKDVILKNIDSDFNTLENNVLGVDQGLTKHWVLGNKQGIFKVGKTDNWKDIEDIINTYKVETAIFDALPDLTEPRKLRDKYVGKIWLSYFKREVKKADYISWDEKTRTVYSDRSKIIQKVIDDFISGKVRFQMKSEELEDYIRHWTALYKATEKDNLGIERDIWMSQGEDHWAFATVYFKLALEKLNRMEVSEWGKDDNSYTSLAPNIQELIRKNEEYS
jgi:hypothetical protein